VSESRETGKTTEGKADATNIFSSTARHNQNRLGFENAATTNQASFRPFFNSLLGLPSGVNATRDLAFDALSGSSNPAPSHSLLSAYSD